MKWRANALEAAKAAEKRLEPLSLLNQQLDAANQKRCRPGTRRPSGLRPGNPGGNTVIPTNPPTKELGKFGGAMAKLLANPEIKKMIAQQQRALLDPLYGPLFKSWAFPEQIQQFKELLLAQQMKASNAAALLADITTGTGGTAQMLADLDRQNGGDQSVPG